MQTHIRQLEGAGEVDSETARAIHQREQGQRLVAVPTEMVGGDLARQFTHPALEDARTQQRLGTGSGHDGW